MKRTCLIESRNEPTDMRLLDWVFCIYLVTTNVTIVTSQLTAAMQNMTYILFVGIVLYLQEFRLRKSAYFGFYGAFLLFSVASLLWTITPSGTMKLLRILIKVFLISIAAASYYNTSNRIERSMKAIYCSLIIMVGYVTIMTPVSNWTSEAFGKEFGIDTVRYAVRAALCAVLGLHFYTKTKKKIHLALCFSMLILSLITAKRTGIVFFAIAALIYYFVLQPNINKRLKAIIIIAIIGLIALQVMESVPILSETIGKRILDFTSTFFGGQMVDASTIQRTKLMGYAIELFKKNPIFGNGLNAMRAYLGALNFEHVTYAHNNYLEIASGLGIVGVVLYYAMYGYGLLQCRKSLRTERKKQTAFILAVLVAYLVCDLMQVSYESYYEIVVLAVLVTGAQNANKEARAAKTVSEA